MATIAVPQKSLLPLSSGYLRREILELAWPAIVENLLVMSVGIADTAMVGRLGAASLAAVDLGNRLVMMALAVFSAVLIGTTAVVARSIGAEDRATADQALRQALIMVAALAVPLLIPGTIFARKCLEFMMLMQESPDVNVMNAGTQYLQITIPFLLFALLMMTVNSCLRGAGDTRTPMVVTGIANIINIVGNYLLIFGIGPFPALGVAGAAWSSNIARMVGVILVLRAVYRGQGRLSLRGSGRFHLDLELMNRILHIGIPAAIEQGLMRGAQLVYTMIVAGMDTVSVAAHAVALTAESISFMPGSGFALAATTLVGQSMGAGEPEQAERNGYEASRMATLVMSAMGVLFFVFPRFLVSLFSKDAAVVDLASRCLRLVAISQPALAWVLTLAGGLRGVGDTRWVMTITLVGFWGVRIPLAYVLAVSTGLGLVGAWIAMVVDLFVRGGLFVFRFRHGGWKGLDV